MVVDESDNDERQHWISRAKELAIYIEAGNEEQVNRLLDELSRRRETNLFQELGKLTREFHEALNSFRLDARIADLTQDHIPDAKQRLGYVISMTEQAANRTLNAVEGSIPLCEELSSRAHSLREQWSRFLQRALTPAEFRTLSRSLDQYLSRAEDDTVRIRDSLSEVLMAQDYQDLTGQILQRVVSLVNEMEEHLVRLIRVSGQRFTDVPIPKGSSYGTVEETDGPVVHGPHVPGTAPEEEVVHGQDDVDALLSSLGF